jgi:hypothetical protein
MPGVPSRLPFCFRYIEVSNLGDRGHEASIEWDGHCGRPGYRSASMGANKRYTNDAIAQRAINVSGADGVDGIAYAQPSGKGAPSSRNATRGR